jgi:PST family polysaccharide transporter
VLRVLRHPLAGNALALSAAQVAITLLPLVTLPYLARVLEAPELGVVLFVQSFSFLLAMLVDFGFGLSAAREVAMRGGRRGELAETVAGVQGAKLVLCAACVGAAVPAWLLVPAFRAEPGLLVLGLVLGVLQGLHPAWFFVGLERARVLAAVDFVARLLGAVAIVVLADDPGDGPLVLGIHVATAVAATGALHVLMYRTVPPRRPRAPLVRAALRTSRTLFVSNAALALYTSANVFLLGLLVSSAQVAFFASAEKVIRAGLRILDQTAKAAYPRVSSLVAAGRPARANRLAVITFAVFVGIALAGALTIVVLAEPLVELAFGPEFAPTVPILRILALLLPLGLATSLLAVLWLLPRRRERLSTQVILVAGVVNVALVLALTPAFGIEGAAWCLIAVEVLAVAALVAVIRRSDILGAADAPPAPPAPADPPPVPA